MARRRKEQENAPLKPIEEMSDSEFITYADYLSSPYYRAYVTANCRFDGEDQSGASAVGAVRKETASYKTTKGKKGKTPKIYTEKRSFFLILIALFMLLTLVISLIGLIKVESISRYIALYNIPQGSISGEDGETTLVFHSIPATDAAMSLLSLCGVNFADEPWYYNYFLSSFADLPVIGKITVLMVPLAVIFTVIFALIGFIKGIIALLSKRDYDGCYKKYKFGFLAAANFLCSLVFLFGGMYVSGIKFVQFADYMLFKSTVMQIGYVIYPLIIMPFLAFIFNLFCYKRQK